MKREQKHNRWRWVVIISLSLILLVVGYVACTAWQIWNYNVVTSHSADAAIVLGASTWRGVPSPVFVERIRHGIELYTIGRIRKLLFTGGAGVGEPISLAEAARDYAIQNGVSPDDIILEPRSRTTLENLTFAKNVAQENGLSTFLVVSDPLHMLRAMRMARDLHLTAWPSATPTTRFTTLKSRLWFLQRETRLYVQYAWFPSTSR